VIPIQTTPNRNRSITPNQAKRGSTWEEREARFI